MTALMINDILSQGQSIITEAYEAGRRDERALNEARFHEMNTAIKMLLKAVSPNDDPLTGAFSDGQDTSAAPPPRIATSNNRAAPGTILRKVTEHLQDALFPQGPLEIVRLARKRGDVLHPSSVRMALQVLTEKGVAERIGRGEYRIALPVAPTEAKADVPISWDGSDEGGNP